MCQIPKRKVTKHLHGLPKKHGVSLEWIAQELWNQFGIKIGDSTLQRMLNPNDFDCKLQADLVPYLCMVCNNDFSVCTFIKKNPQKIEISIKTIAKLTKEAGEAMAALAESIEDGVITRDERQRCISELMDLKDIVSKLLASLIK